MKPSPSTLRQILHPVVIVGALGYFVDVYDLILFSIVRGASLKGLGVPPDQILAKGVLLLNWQMGGMVIGGLVAQKVAWQHAYFIGGGLGLGLLVLRLSVAESKMFQQLRAGQSGV